jgi:putative oxidoreductase
MVLENTVLLVARVLIAVIFLWAGGRKVLNWSGTEEYMKAKQTKWISILLPIAVSLQILGALSLILGVYARIGALLLILFIIPATIQMHDFWNLTGKERIMEKAHFLKDLAIVGGLLLVMLYGAGQYSLM